MARIEHFHDPLAPKANSIVVAVTAFEVSDLIGVYSDPAHVVEYSDGEVRQQFSLCFRAGYVSGEPATSDESSEVRWVHRDELDALDIHPSMRLRIDHGYEHRPKPYIG